MKIKEVVNYIIAYLILIVVLFTSDSVTGQIVGIDICQILFIFLIFLLFAINISVINKNFYITVSFLSAFLILLWVFYTNLFHDEHSSAYLNFLIRISLTYIYIWILSKVKIDVFRIITNLIVIIAGYSIIFYIFLNILKINIPNGYTQVIGYPIYYNYFNIYFSSQNIFWSNLSFARNQGLFLEPGSYQIYLNFALIYLIFKETKIKIVTIILIILNIITTFSTTGLILCLAICFFGFIRKNYSVYNKLKYLLIPFVAYLLYLSVQYILNQKIGTNSYDVRSNDLFMAIDLFKQKPIFGWGFYNYDVINLIRENGVGNSNGLLTLLYQMGIFGTVFYLLPIVVYTFNDKKETLYRITILLFFITANMNEPVIYSSFMIIFLSNAFYYIFKDKFSKA